MELAQTDALTARWVAWDAWRTTRGGPKAVTARHRSHATNSPTSSNRTRSHARAREARNSNQSLASYAYAFSVFGDRSTTVSDSR